MKIDEEWSQIDVNSSLQFLRLNWRPRRARWSDRDALKKRPKLEDKDVHRVLVVF